MISFDVLDGVWIVILADTGFPFDYQFVMTLVRLPGAVRTPYFRIPAERRGTYYVPTEAE